MEYLVSCATRFSVRYLDWNYRLRRVASGEFIILLHWLSDVFTLWHFVWNRSEGVTCRQRDLMTQSVVRICFPNTVQNSCYRWWLLDLCLCDGIAVTDCQPIVKDLDVLLGKLRETNDWHQFVVELRRQFTRLIWLHRRHLNCVVLIEKLLLLLCNFALLFIQICMTAAIPCKLTKHIFQNFYWSSSELP